MWYNFANLARDQERRPQARLGYQEALRLWPDYVIALNNLATVTSNQTDIERLLLTALRQPHRVTLVILQSAEQ